MFTLEPVIRRPLKKILATVALMAVVATGYTASVAHAATETIDVGSQSGTYSKKVRGFWFTAPTDFWITGVDVPLDASIANFDASILRLGEEPPVFSASTTAFDILHEARDQATAITGLSIAINAGDKIGVLGYRGGKNSYASGPVTSSIFGNTVTLKRFGTQNSIVTTSSAAGLGVWTENRSSSIGRVNLAISNVAPVAPVPLPASLPLALCGLSGLMALRRRKRAT